MGVIIIQVMPPQDAKKLYEPKNIAFCCVGNYCWDTKKAIRNYLGFHYREPWGFWQICAIITDNLPDSALYESDYKKNVNIIDEYINKQQVQFYAHNFKGYVVHRNPTRSIYMFRCIG